MGMTGLSIAWNRAEYFFDSGVCQSSGLLTLTILWMLALTLVYALKIIKYPADVIAEVTHPVKQAFVPTFSISLLLLSVAYLESARDFSFWLWSIGATLHLGLTFYILSSWLHLNKYEIAHLNPAWFIPAVGNVIVPVAGARLGYGICSGPDVVEAIARREPAQPGSQRRAGRGQHAQVPAAQDRARQRQLRVEARRDLLFRRRRAGLRHAFCDQ